MIGITTEIFDLAGARYFTRSELDQRIVNQNDRRTRRMTRTPTLDGGVSVSDNGYAAGDRDIIVRVSNPSEAIRNYMAYIVETYSRVIVSTEEGVFVGNPSAYSMDADGAVNLTVNIISELTA